MIILKIILATGWQTAHSGMKIEKKEASLETTAVVWVKSASDLN